MSPLLMGDPITKVTEIDKRPDVAALTSVDGIDPIDPATRSTPVPGDLLEELLRSGPEHALERVRSGRVPAGFSLQRLGEGAAANASLEEGRRPAFLWAETAIHAFDLVGDEERAMALRTLLVTRFGPEARSLSDPEPVMDWLKRSVPLTPDELVERARDWKEKSREEILKLRQIKNRLSIVARLAESFPECVDDETRGLLDVRQQLP